MDLAKRCMQAENAPSQLAGMRLLVVDDNADTRMLFAFVLEDYGAEVVAVSSVEEAIAAIRMCKPDLLISDINLLGEDGYSLIRRVRNMNVEQGSQIPAIAVSGTSPEFATESHCLGFQLHLIKPVEPADLVKAVLSLTQNAIPA